MIKSPYSGTFASASLVLDETNAILPLLLSENADALIKQELAENNLLKINSQTTRTNVVHEISRRFKAVPVDFWHEYQSLPEANQRMYLFYANLKCYKLLFELHFNVAVPKYRSVTMHIATSDLEMYMNELAAIDPAVAKWKENSIKKYAKVFLTMLKQVGLINELTGELQSIDLPPDAYRYFVDKREMWFLEACLLAPYKIKNITNALI